MERHTIKSAITVMLFCVHKTTIPTFLNTSKHSSKDSTTGQIHSAGYKRSVHEGGAATQKSLLWTIPGLAQLNVDPWSGVSTKTSVIQTNIR